MLKRDDGDLECCSYRGCSFVEEWFAVENSGSIKMSPISESIQINLSTDSRTHI